MKLPLKKVTKKLHFLQKNKMKILLPMGKNHVFFLDFRQNLKVKNQKSDFLRFFRLQIRFIWFKIGHKK